MKAAVLLLSILTLMPVVSSAELSAVTEYLLDTPASQMDLFIYRLREDLESNESSFEVDKYSTVVETYYDSERDLIVIGMSLIPSYNLDTKDGPSEWYFRDNAEKMIDHLQLLYTKNNFGRVSFLAGNHTREKVDITIFDLAARMVIKITGSGPIDDDTGEYEVYYLETPLDTDNPVFSKETLVSEWWPEYRKKSDG